MVVVSNWLAATASVETYSDRIPLGLMPIGRTNAVLYTVIRDVNLSKL